MTPDDAVVQELEALEQRRCAATAAGDTATLNEIFSPDMLFVHFRGKTEGREAYVAAVEGNPRSIEIGEMKIECFGDTAVMLGKHDITRQNPTRVIDAFGTRVVRKTAAGWRYVLIQVSPSTVQK
ncbi:ketosteroid isomerase-like protein [Sphingomonas vulcanisoli]|uniref:Ketosteroid isomerase-like protein n=1 Tax=Sphingomonas vulcanisoli TaxID=1658060 RepID=A0ABX0TYG1_9SPHN|nr:nuclear transport factor 2 family protein [Sphingomonas vulcanisoli]NIJ09244.1 ketosteroid isomerase-like protein [Sphingomonas vulcanisoli]